MFDIDDALADVVARSTQPALGAIKLAWWRERLEELDKDIVPAEPRLQAAATELLPRRITGADIALLERGWSAMLEQEPDHNVRFHAGEHLFRLAARLLSPDAAPVVETVGRIYAGAHLARRGLARDCLSATSDVGRIPREFRPLTALAALGARDLRNEIPVFEAEATPARAWTLLRHRLTGRI